MLAFYRYSPLTVAAGHPFFEDSEKIQHCLIRRGGEFVGFQNGENSGSANSLGLDFFGSFLGNAKKNKCELKQYIIEKNYEPIP